MAIFRTVKSKNYSIMHNGFLTDNNLSLKAKGLLAYFLSRPDDWRFYTNEIVKNCKDGSNSVSSAIKELITLGYIERFKKRDDKGRFYGGFEYLVYETPKKEEDAINYENNTGTIEEEHKVKRPEIEISKLEKPNMDNPNVENPDMENPRVDKPDVEIPNMKNPLLLNTEYKLSTEYKQNTEAKINTKYKPNTKTPQPPKYKETNKDLDIKNKDKRPTNEKWCRGSNEDIYEFYLDNGFGKINNVVINILDNNIKNYSKEKVKAAMIEAIKNNKYTLSYVEGILKNKRGKFKENKEVSRVGEHGTSYEEELRREGLILTIDDL